MEIGKRIMLIPWVVGDSLEHIVYVSCVETVRNVLGTVHAEPVCTCEPYLVAVHVVKAAALCVEPVVICVVSCQSLSKCVGSRH